MKKLILFAFILLTLSSCKKEEPEPFKDTIEFKFTCPRKFDVKVIFDQQVKEVKGDSGVVYVQFEYVEQSKADRYHYFEYCIAADHKENIEVSIWGPGSGKSSNIQGPGYNCSGVERIVF